MSSWVDGADGSDFPIQNLPFGIFSNVPTGRAQRPGVAIGSFVLDMKALSVAGLIDGLQDGLDAQIIFSGTNLNAFMECKHTYWSAIRARLTSLLAVDGDSSLRANADLRQKCLVKQEEVRVPALQRLAHYRHGFARG